MAFITSRILTLRGLPPVFGGGINGSIICHWLSLKSLGYGLRSISQFNSFFENYELFKHALRDKLDLEFGLNKCFDEDKEYLCLFSNYPIHFFKAKPVSKNMQRFQYCRAIVSEQFPNAFLHVKRQLGIAVMARNLIATFWILALLYFFDITIWDTTQWSSEHLEVDTCWIILGLILLGLISFHRYNLLHKILVCNVYRLAHIYVKNKTCAKHNVKYSRKRKIKFPS